MPPNLVPSIIRFIVPSIIRFIAPSIIRFIVPSIIRFIVPFVIRFIVFFVIPSVLPSVVSFIMPFATPSPSVFCSGMTQLFSHHLVNATALALALLCMMVFTCCSQHLCQIPSVHTF